MDNLKKKALEIRDQKKIGGNTQELVGGLFEGIVDSMQQLAPKSQVNELKNQVSNLETYKKGYFSTSETLKKAYPNPKPGWYAYVGDGNDGTTNTIWEEQKGGWINSRKPIPSDVLILDDFAPIINTKGEQVVYAKDGVVEIPKDVLTESNTSDKIKGITNEDEIAFEYPEFIDPYPDDWVIGQTIGGDGVTIYIDKDWGHSPTYIEVVEGELYTSYRVSGICYYDQDKRFIKYHDRFPNQRFRPDVGVKYIRIARVPRLIIEAGGPSIARYLTSSEKEGLRVNIGAGDLKNASPFTGSVSIPLPELVNGNYIGYGPDYYISTDPNSFMTDFLPVSPYGIYKGSGFKAKESAYAIFDQNKRIIGAGYGGGNAEFVEKPRTMPFNAAYIRYNASEAGKHTMKFERIFSEGSYSVGNLIVPAANIVGLEQIIGGGEDKDKEPVPCINLGDSHSNGFGGYTPWIARLAVALNLELTNLAVAGVTVVDGLPKQIAKIPAGFSGIITMLMGANDMIAHVNNGKDLGSAETALKKGYSSLDVTLFYEAWRKYIIDIRNQFPKAQLICFQDIYMKWYNDKMTKYNEFVNGKRSICEAESIPFISMGAMAWSKNSLDMPDELHPNDYRHRVLALSIYPYMKGIVEGKRLLKV